MRKYVIRDTLSCDSEWQFYDHLSDRRTSFSDDLSPRLTPIEDDDGDLEYGKTSSHTSFEEDEEEEGGDKDIIGGAKNVKAESNSGI